ncbi:hypothetical protein UR09_05970 [Candidatus Nitromaritima sp. SCGC AAA799-A02]|nr:hypothetical protein UR09_05970 [Candidatus Nitromaritima sp. SCGC AAA799-A02]KMP12359.1 hypothetical protein UZ36_01235 [Candidatus Nitromaritima sp. SCGC AAA799-C22]
MFEPNQIISYMNELTFFKDFSHEEKRKITHCESSLIRCLPKKLLIKEGSTDIAVFVLIDGLAIITKDEAPETTIATLKPGDVFGELSFITKKPRATNVITKSKAVALKLTPEVWKELGSDISRKFYAQLLRILINRITNLNDTVIQLKKEVEMCAGADTSLPDEINSALEIESKLKEKLEAIQKSMGEIIR